jgi:LEA14-like dessication related protein
MIPKLTRLLTLPVFAFAVFLGGCESIPKDLAGLEVDLIGMRSFNTLPDGSRELVVTVRCRNETVRPIGIREVRIDLKVNGIALGKASSDKPIATQALSTNTGDITFKIDEEGLAQLLATEFDRTSVNYEMTTRLVIFSAGEHLSSKSSSSGVVDITNLRRKTVR